MYCVHVRKDLRYSKLY